MKKVITIILIVIVSAGFLVAGSTRAEAMDNEAAAVLTAGMFLMGIPIMHAIVRDAVHHGHAYSPPRYIERTKIVYAEPRHYRKHRHGHRDHDRDCRHEGDRHKHRRGHKDAHRDSHRDHDGGWRR